MKISLITVCYNAEISIETCILSVLNQKNVDVEYIVIDGGSTDSTNEIIAKYRSNISKYISEPDNGLYDAMNKGIHLATGDVIGMLNADDVFANNNVLSTIAKQFEVLSINALYADLKYVNGSKVVRYWKSGTYNKNNWFLGWMPPHPTFYVRREVYQKYGSFDTNLKLAADYELMLRFLFKNDVSVSYLPMVTVLMAVGGESNKNITNRMKANVEDKKAWKLNQLSMPFYLPFLKPLRKVLQFVLK